MGEIGSLSPTTLKILLLLFSFFSEVDKPANITHAARVKVKGKEEGKREA